MKCQCSLIIRKSIYLMFISVYSCCMHLPATFHRYNKMHALQLPCPQICPQETKLLSLAAEHAVM